MMCPQVYDKTLFTASATRMHDAAMTMPKLVFMQYGVMMYFRAL